MRLSVYCVRDAKVGAYMAPFFMRSRGEALRSWETVVNDPSTQFFKYPGDFCLFELGSFDEDSGSFDLHPSPLSLGLAVDVKRVADSDVPLPILEHINAQKAGK